MWILKRSIEPWAKEVITEDANALMMTDQPVEIALTSSSNIAIG
jgi:hypothetical protein